MGRRVTRRALDACDERDYVVRRAVFVIILGVQPGIRAELAAVGGSVQRLVPVAVALKLEAA